VSIIIVIIWELYLAAPAKREITRTAHQQNHPAARNFDFPPLGCSFSPTALMIFLPLPIFSRKKARLFALAAAAIELK
jgi:hypothetical protein